MAWAQLSPPLAGKGAAAKTKGKKSAIAALQRPIICICNDLHSPNLKALKQVRERTMNRDHNSQPFPSSKGGLRAAV